MEADELCPRVAPHHVASSLLQIPVTGKVSSMKRPVGMCVQFLPTFVEPVNRQKEGFGIGDMDGNRHLQRARRLPHRIESCVVDANELLAARFAQVKTQRL